MLDAFEDWCAEQLETTQSASISVAIGRDGELVYTNTFGFADIQGRRRADPATPYLLASITKPMTATAVCALAQAGYLDLDEPIEAHLGGLRFVRRGDVDGAPTVAQVLQHTSGLDTYFDFFYADGAQPDRRDFAETMSRYAVLFAPPGRRYRYSNLGYGILDELIRNVTGAEPADFVRQTVFEPLGMNSACIGPAYSGTHQPAMRYSPDGSPYPNYDTSHRGASLAWMTAADLVTFGLGHAGGRSVLSAAMHARMIDDIEIGGGRGYGLGWEMTHVNGSVVVGHGGGMGGVSTALAVMPSERIAIAVLNNRPREDKLTRRVLERLAAELLPQFRPSRPSPPSPPPPRTATSRLPRRDWIGSIRTYAGDLTLALSRTADGGYSVSLDGGPSVSAELGSGGGPSDLVINVGLQVPTPDALVQSPSLTLDLVLDGDTLNGVAAAAPAMSSTIPSRLGNHYPHWCELVRT